MLSLIATNDLGNLKIVEKILEESTEVLDQLVKTPEEEYFRILSDTVEPLKTAIADIEVVIDILIKMGIVSVEAIANVELTSTSFYENMMNIYRNGKLSEENFNQLLEAAKYKLLKLDKKLNTEKESVIFFS